MAKSKLYNKVSTAVEAYGQTYNAFLQESSHGTPSDQTLHTLQAQGTAVQAALTEASTHFANLEKRMGPDKTVGDRLRNLKNVFKDSTALAAARKKTKADLDYCESAFDGIQRGITMVQTIKQRGGI